MGTTWSSAVIFEFILVTLVFAALIADAIYWNKAKNDLSAAGSTVTYPTTMFGISVAAAVVAGIAWFIVLWALLFQNSAVVRRGAAYVQNRYENAAINYGRRLERERQMAPTYEVLVPTRDPNTGYPGWTRVKVPVGAAPPLGSVPVASPVGPPGGLPIPVASPPAIPVASYVPPPTPYPPGFVSQAPPVLPSPAYITAPVGIPPAGYSGTYPSYAPATIPVLQPYEPAKFYSTQAPTATTTVATYSTQPVPGTYPVQPPYVQLPPQATNQPPVNITVQPQQPQFVPVSTPEGQISTRGPGGVPVPPQFPSQPIQRDTLLGAENLRRGEVYLRRDSDGNFRPYIVNGQGQLVPQT